MQIIIRTHETIAAIFNISRHEIERLTPFKDTKSKMLLRQYYHDGNNIPLQSIQINFINDDNGILFMEGNLRFIFIFANYRRDDFDNSIQQSKKQIIEIVPQLPLSSSLPSSLSRNPSCLFRKKIKNTIISNTAINNNQYQNQNNHDNRIFPSASII